MSEQERVGARLCRGLAVVTAHDRLVIEGGPRRQVFRGKTATEVLPRLLRLLDNNPRIVDLTGDLGITSTQLAQVLNLLDAHGVLERIDPTRGADRTLSFAHTYFSRNLGASGGYRSTSDLTHALSSVAVYVVGGQGAAVALAEDLRSAGAANVTSGNELSTQQAQALQQSQRPLAIVVDSPDDTDRLVRTVSLAGGFDVPVLRVASGSDAIQVGPVFYPGHTVCPDCLWQSLRDESWVADPKASSVSDDALAGFACQEALAVALNLPNMSPPRTVSQVDLNDYSSERWLLLPSDGCVVCADLALSLREGSDARPVDVYEWLMAEQPAHLSRGEDHSLARREMIDRLEKERPDLRTQPRQALPDISKPLAEAPNDERDRRSTNTAILELVSEITARTAGFRSQSADERQRWTASAGNLGSIQLYLITDSGVPGLPGSIFCYDDLRHELVAVAPDHVSLTRALKGTDLEVPPPGGFVLVMVGARVRLTRKYGDFALRLIHLDAGCVATQLSVVAAGYGLAVEFAAAWDGNLAELINLEEDGFVITAVARVFDPSANGGPHAARSV